ncbi:hypothetical protein [Stenotrophomonas sp. SY1]|uniref:hypothetical protein n=1 Tax=Stenotrophomonas sp. SY1 TaxID=477235 RepID=UPI001E3C5BB5|nr:hypothetical protein [Stenotrophomonas sp. SY1]MCD9087532.1 hypothetical protein [Stenotrophomonas sp. SY1]
MSQESKLIEQIERVLSKFPAVAATWHSGNLVAGFRDAVAYHSLRTECIALINFVYGVEHAQASEFRRTIRREALHDLHAAEGMLRGAIESIRHGLLNDLRTEILLDVQTDFLGAAQTALEGGAKDVAAALSAVVLEDSVKRLAAKHGLDDLINQEFSVVITGLFKADAITKATKGALLAHKDLRNAALHAQWHEVSAEAVQALLYLLPVFIEQHGV